MADEAAPEHYLAAAQRAKNIPLRLWASDLTLPREWRAAHKTKEPAASATRAVSTPSQSGPRAYRNQHGCAIKGNRSRRGEWIYHLPRQQYYAQTRPEELFCTEGEARAAGYRRSKVKIGKSEFRTSPL